MNKKSYVGIDYFRVIAAILVVAIHTSPLIDISEIGDFAFTRIIARVAVPFFFVTSGYFVVSRYAHDSKKLMGFLKKTAIIYGISMLIYIPINLYNSYFSMNNLLPSVYAITSCVISNKIVIFLLICFTCLSLFDSVNCNTVIPSFCV